MTNNYDFYDLKKVEKLANHPEVIEDDGYYWDPTPLPSKDYQDSEVPSGIKAVADYVRSKMKGQDVREAMARIAEMMGINVNKATNIAREAEQIAENNRLRQDTLETQTAQSVARMEADKDAVIANATVDSEVILARGGKATLGQRLDETTAQLEQTGRSVSQEIIVANSLGLIEGENTLEAAETNTRILNNLLNSHDNIQIDGVYFVNDITRDRTQTLTLQGDFELHNFNSLNHLIHFKGRINHSGSMYINGNRKYVDGVIFENVNGSVFGKITTRECRGWGLRVKAKGNNNSVAIHSIRSEFNGDIKNQSVSVASKTGTTYNQRTILNLGEQLPTKAFEQKTPSGVIVGKSFYEVVDVLQNASGEHQLEVRPNFPQNVGEKVQDVVVLLGGGLLFEVYSDTNWWNIGTYSSSDRAVAGDVNTLYGHTFGNVLFDSPRVGFITGTKRETFNSQFNHIYTEPAVDFPIVTYRGKFTLIEPLYDYTAKPTSVYQLFGEALDASNVGVIVNGDFYASKDIQIFKNSSSIKTLEPGKTLFIDESVGGDLEILLKTKTIVGYEVKDTATLIYLNRYDLDGENWSKDVIFKSEEGYPINKGTTEYKFSSSGEEKYIFYATFTGDSWFVVRSIVD